MGCDLDLVAVQQRRRLGAQPDAVDQHLRLRYRLCDYDLPVREPLELGMARENAGTGEVDRAACVAAEHHVSRRDGELPPAHFE